MPTRSRALPYPLAVLALALAYFAAGWLGHYLAVPPADVSPDWPPSGIALAGLLLLGPRVWPGVWLGAFAINLLTITVPGESLGLGRALFTSAVISAGATFQAALGALLVRGAAGGAEP